MKTKKRKQFYCPPRDHQHHCRYGNETEIPSFPPRDDDDGNEDTKTTKDKSTVSILDVITGEVLQTAICDFLVPDEIVALLHVNEIFDSYEQLRMTYCKLHGTRLDRSYEDDVERKQRQNNVVDNDRNDSNADVEFIIWAEENQKFILADQSTLRIDTDCNFLDDEKPASLYPDCEECRMARFYLKKKCHICKDFEHYTNFNGTTRCAGKCQTSGCEACLSYMCQDPNCTKSGLCYCEICFDGFYCGYCEQEYHNACVPSTKCGECNTVVYCNTCTDSGHNEAAYTCVVCVKLFCQDCKDHSWCSQCKKEFCDDCRDSFYCEYCDEPFCRDCDDGIHCSTCGEPSCSKCDMSYHCDTCDTFYCKDCRPKLSCVCCNTSYCNVCEREDEEDHKNIIYEEPYFCSGCRRIGTEHC